jgi:hypothetical protein
VNYNIKKHKIIIFTSIISILIIIINPSIAAIQYTQIKNTIQIENNINILNNEIIIQIIDIIIKILESIFILPLIFVEEIIDTIWALIDQIEDPFIKIICTVYNLIIETLWYICLGFCSPIFFIVYILTLIRDSLEPNKILNETTFYSLNPKNLIIPFAFQISTLKMLNHQNHFSY